MKNLKKLLLGGLLLVFLVPSVSLANILIDFHSSKIYIEVDGERIDNSWMVRRAQKNKVADEEPSDFFYYVATEEGKMQPAGIMAMTEYPKRNSWTLLEYSSPIEINPEAEKYLSYEGESYNWEDPFYNQRQDAIVKSIDLTEFSRNWAPELMPKEKIDYTVHINSETGEINVTEENNGPVEVKTQKESDLIFLLTILGVALLGILIIGAIIILFIKRKK